MKNRSFCLGMHIMLCMHSKLDNRNTFYKVFDLITTQLSVLSIVPILNSYKHDEKETILKINAVCCSKTKSVKI